MNGRDRGDDHYREVARMHERCATPGATLARLYDVPRTTAHYWIKEARRRGFLAPRSPDCHRCRLPREWHDTPSREECIRLLRSQLNTTTAILARAVDLLEHGFPVA